VAGEIETLVGSSPELLISSLSSQIQTRPIAGTRPRGADKEEDLARADELLADPKEMAEHAMLVDLGRNDLGRVSEYGSVKVTEYAGIQTFSHVMHIVSTVEGKLAPASDSLDALKSVFPAGTLSGAPKVRAMEILQTSEPTRRGAYGGALGIVRWNGDLDFCITIRTLSVRENEVSVQSGAGIVYDSVPEREYEETLHKARALFKVVESLQN
jgi:anthranilate synthase component 1